MEVGLTAVGRIRQRYVEEGLGAALERRRSEPIYERQLDGEGEAHLVALAHEPVGLVRVQDRILVYYCTSLIRELDLIGQRSAAADRWPQPTMRKECPDNDV